MSPTPLVYFAHPIDFASRDYAGEVAYSMNEAGLAAYIPSYAFKIPLGQPPNERLNRINRAALTECDGLVAFLPAPGDQSYGVPMEIEMAREQGKPTLIVGDSEIWSCSWAMPKTELHIYTDQVQNLRGSFGTLAALIAREKRNRNRPPASRALYTKLDPGALLPTRSYEGDAGFDLYALGDTEIPAGGFVDVPMGCSVQLPDGVWAMITGRSSTVRNLDLLVTTGIIDTGYRGPLFAGVRSLRDEGYTVKRGERIAQLIPFPNLAQNMHATAVDVLSSSDRGELGFGSSGS